MIAPDIKEFERVVRNFLTDYGKYAKTMETGWEVYKDDYGEPLFAAPVLNVKFKDDADILAELQDHKHIRVIH